MFGAAVVFGLAQRAALVTAALLLGACATAPPPQPDDICAIFRDKSGWYQDSVAARKNWRSPIPVMMAIMHQESRFQSQAKPPRTKILGFIPGPRPSSAFGYSQAKKATWGDYQLSSGNYGADRDDFDDAIDFIGWYNNTSGKRSNIAVDDSYHLYLAYHEGHGGFNRRTFKNKAWLKAVASKVSAMAGRYRVQLQRCEKSLKKSWWNPF